MKLQLLFASGLLCLGTLSIAQNTGGQVPTAPQTSKYHCGTTAPGPEWDAWFNQKVKERRESAAANGQERVTTITIPVIVHVIHGGQPVGTFPNISQAQINSQIKVLNEDFAGVGFNSGNLAATGFSTVGAANTNINFCLAQFDPDGQALTEPGIDRISYVTEGWTNPAVPGSFSNFQTLMNGSIKPGSIWDPTLYFNIWVTDANPSLYLLGYATFPGGTTLNGVNSNNIGSGINDGIWVWSRCFGDIGDVMAPYNKGRTAVHETGHWLGLRHIGGDASNPSGDCSATDFCNDTPPQKGGHAQGGNGQNYGAPVYPIHVNVCGSQYGDMFMNFMDYTEDAILYMFTPDQSERMNTALSEGYFRNQLSASSVTQCIGLPVVELLDETWGCAQSDLKLATDNASLPGTYSWTVYPSAGVTFNPDNTVANPGITFANVGSYTITTTSSNAVGQSASYGVIHVEECVGINEKTSSGRKISIAPNPVSTRLKINTAGLPGNVLLLVFNALGEKVGNYSFTSEQTVNELDVEKFANGLYILQFSNGSEIAVKRIVVAH